MDYTLAKELKDVGFPQKFNIGRPHYSEKDATFGNVNNLTDGADKICIPTLGELIEECGESFISLSRWTESAGKSTWQVRGKKGHVDFVYLGSKPERAVARLYIGLNKHD